GTDDAPHTARGLSARVDLHPLVTNVVDDDVPAKLVLAVAEPHLIAEPDDTRGEVVLDHAGLSAYLAVRLAAALLEVSGRAFHPGLGELPIEERRARRRRLQIRVGRADVNGLAERPAAVVRV